ncbi:MAG: type II toxin-antitoxin system RelE/ParE family toxin [Hyphomicrobium sp.]
MSIAEKKIYWWGSTLKDLRTLPEGARADIGYGLRMAQEGKKAPSAKPLTGLKEFKGSKVLEIVSTAEGDAYRGVYTVEFDEAIYLIDAFQKKSKAGIATPKADIDRIVGRIKDVRDWRRTADGKASIEWLNEDRKARQAIFDLQEEQEKVNALKGK